MHKLCSLLLLLLLLCPAILAVPKGVGEGTEPKLNTLLLDLNQPPVDENPVNPISILQTNEDRHLETEPTPTQLTDLEDGLLLLSDAALNILTEPKDVERGTKRKLDTDPAGLPRSTKRKAPMPATVASVSKPPIPAVASTSSLPNHFDLTAVLSGPSIDLNVDLSPEEVNIRESVQKQTLELEAFHSTKAKMQGNEGRKEQCPLCLKKFFYLKSHMKTHLSENERNEGRKEQCPQCEKKFSYPSKLTTHMETHLSENERNEGRKEQCPYCVKKFFYHSKLKMHMKTHLSKHERVMVPCRFEECGSEFTCISSEKTHFRNVHKDGLEKFPQAPAPGGKQHICRRCRRLFKTSRMRDKHFESKHRK